MKGISKICAILALSLAALQTTVSAQDRHSIEGVWDVSVSVTNCDTGALIRTLRSIQLFQPDGSFAETANTFLRGSSEGVWNHTGDEIYDATYWFFRYNPDGTFASIASAVDNVELSEDGTTFTASGVIQDHNAEGALISTGCFTHTATRLSGPIRDRHDNDE
jgi:hypothetical protein